MIFIETNLIKLEKVKVTLKNYKINFKVFLKLLTNSKTNSKLATRSLKNL